MIQHPELHCGKRFEKISYASQSLQGAEFESCVFRECDFSYTDFAEALLVDCRMESCRFVVPKLENSHLRNVVFEKCRLAGLDFGQCAAPGFSVEFRGSRTESCSFYQRKMGRTRFDDSELIACLFADCDLTEASFAGCRLTDTDFDRCRLGGADFRTAVDFRIDPVSNTIKKARFSHDNLAGLLTGFDLVIE